MFTRLDVLRTSSIRDFRDQQPDELSCLAASTIKRMQRSAPTEGHVLAENGGSEETQSKTLILQFGVANLDPLLDALPQVFRDIIRKRVQALKHLIR